MPHRKTGTEKCPHVDRKSGKRCNKLGRHNPNPMVSWNPKFDKGKKRAYVQFIHNDGTRHNIATLQEYRLEQMKGHQFEEHFKTATALGNLFHRQGDYWMKVAESSLYWDLSESKWCYLIGELNQGNFEPIKKKYDQEQRKKRRDIYDNSQDTNDKKYRYHKSLEFEQIDKLAKRILLDKDDAKMKSLLEQIGPEQGPIVIQRCLELRKAYLRRLDDKQEMLRQVLRERFNGNLPPELERKLVARS